MKGQTPRAAYGGDTKTFPSLGLGRFGHDRRGISQKSTGFCEVVEERREGSQACLRFCEYIRSSEVTE